MPIYGNVYRNFLLFMKIDLEKMLLIRSIHISRLLFVCIPSSIYLSRFYFIDLCERGLAVTPCISS